MTIQLKYTTVGSDEPHPSLSHRISVYDASDEDVKLSITTYSGGNIRQMLSMINLSKTLIDIHMSQYFDGAYEWRLPYDKQLLAKWPWIIMAHDSALLWCKLVQSMPVVEFIEATWHGEQLVVVGE